MLHSHQEDLNFRVALYSIVSSAGILPNALLVTKITQKYPVVKRFNIEPLS
jgi:hypothetical protein